MERIVSERLVVGRDLITKSTYWCTGLVGRKGTGKAVLLMVRPRAKVLSVGALDVLAVTVGTECIPCLTFLVVEDARVGKVVADD